MQQFIKLSSKFIFIVMEQLYDQCKLSAYSGEKEKGLKRHIYN